MHNRDVIVHSLTYKFLRGVASEISVTEERTLQLLYIWRYQVKRFCEVYLSNVRHWD